MKQNSRQYGSFGDFFIAKIYNQVLTRKTEKDRKSILAGNVLREGKELTMILSLETRTIVHNWQK